MNASLGATVKDFRDARETAPRSAFWKVDPLLFLGAVGLIVCSIYVVGNATQDDIPGNPDYYLVRQAAYGAIGIVFMIVLARFDYSRMREWRWGIYGTMIGLILLVLAIGSAAKGSQRWIPLPFFNLQSSELGKLLLVLALAGFMVERLRYLGDKETTSRILLAAIFPAMLPPPPLPQPARGDLPGDAGDRPARPRLGARLHGDSGGDPLRRRHQVDPLPR